MELFNKKNRVCGLGVPDSERVRYEVARNIYPTLINQCYRETHTQSAYRDLPATAAKRTLVYADELVAALGAHSSGNLSRQLEDLEESGFVRHYLPAGGLNGGLYQLVDPLSLFWMRFVNAPLSPA